MRSAGVLLVVSISVLAIIGCQTSAPPATASPANSAAATASVDPGTISTPAASLAESSSAGATPTGIPPVVRGSFDIGPGSLYLADPRAGLDALASYIETLTVSFAGTADGQPQSWSKAYRLQRTAQPAASVVTLEVTGDAESPDPSALAEASGASYEQRADGSCTGRPLNPDDSPLAANDPAALLPGLMGAEEAGAEEVNGISTGHCTFDERATLDGGAATSVGEVWVAEAGGYVVRFVLRTVADAAYFGAGLAGTMTWDYELSDVNALDVLALPGGCQLDAPAMADAQNLLVLPEYLGYDSASSIGDVAQFYQQQLSAEGWTLQADPSISADTAVASFIKGGQALNVIVTTTDGGTHVDLALTSAS